MRLCGINEICFEEGTDVWGHLGVCMCVHVTENSNTSICGKTKETVNMYTSEAEYNKLTKRKL